MTISFVIMKKKNSRRSKRKDISFFSKDYQQTILVRAQFIDFVEIHAKKVIAVGQNLGHRHCLQYGDHRTIVSLQILDNQFSNFSFHDKSSYLMFVSCCESQDDLIYSSTLLTNYSITHFT